MKNKKKFLILGLILILFCIIPNQSVKALDFQDNFPGYGCISNSISTNNGGYFKNNYYWFRSNNPNTIATVTVNSWINKSVDDKNRLLALSWQRPDGQKTPIVNCSYNNGQYSTASCNITYSGTYFFNTLLDDELTGYGFWFDAAVDNYAPVIKSFNGSATASDINFTFSVQDTDHANERKRGCGTKNVKFSIYPQGESEQNAYTFNEDYDDGTFSVARPVPQKFYSKYGTWICKVTTTDNLGNSRTYSYTFNRENKLNPSPNVKAEITKYDYMESKYKVWIKAGNSTQFKITSSCNSDYTNAYKNFTPISPSEYPKVYQYEWLLYNYRDGHSFNNAYGYPYATLCKIELNDTEVYYNLSGIDGKTTQKTDSSGLNYKSHSTQKSLINQCGTITSNLEFQSSANNLGEPFTIKASSLTLHPTTISAREVLYNYDGSVKDTVDYKYTWDTAYGYNTGRLLSKLDENVMFTSPYIADDIKNNSSYVSEANDRSIYIDGTAPTCETIGMLKNNVEEVNFLVNNVVDYANTRIYNSYDAKKGSGVKKIEVALVPDTENNFDVYGTKYFKDAIFKDTDGEKFVYYYDESNDYYGYYNAYVRFTDNVGNQSYYIWKNILRAKPNPKTVEVDLVYDASNNNIYKDNSNRVWIKNNVTVKYDLIALSSEDYSKATDGYPTKLSFYYNRYDKAKNLITSKDISGNATYLNDTKSFTYTNSSKSLPYTNSAITRGTKDKNKYLNTTITVKGTDIANNTGFMPYVTASTTRNSTEYNYENGYVNEKDGEYLYVDSKAPVYSSKKIDRQQDYFTITLEGVKDNESGLKSVTAKVWIDGNDNSAKNVSVTKVTNEKYLLKVNKSDFNNNKKNYRYEITLTDNVGNTTIISNINDDVVNMICYNLKAKSINIYDPRENRVVTQLISGYEYIARITYSNTEIDDITMPYHIALDISKTKQIIISGTSIKSGETKVAEIKFTAGEENLYGEVYTGILDFNNTITEEDETDNEVSTQKPYKKKVDDDNPPIIPDGDTPPEEIPVITIKIDFEANYINPLDEKGIVLNELIAEDTYNVKTIVKNNSSLNIKYLDIKNKSFTNSVLYDGLLIDTYEINDIGAGKTISHLTEYKIPLLTDNNVLDSLKPFALKVDSNDKIYECNETNNYISVDKRILSLKLYDYRITDIVYPVLNYDFPLYIDEMPVVATAGYNVTFRANVKGHPTDVYTKIKLSNGTELPIHTMNKIEDIDDHTAVYEFTFTVPIDTPLDNVIYTAPYAARNSVVYDHNTEEKWDGLTITFNGNARKDIRVYRQY